MSEPARTDRPVTLLIAALGGEGGGVLTDWIVAAATHAGLPVQSTSIPGVAQRTGATTYYLEIFPRPETHDPVMALHPCPGNVDLMLASELLEAARAMENGFVTPERTTLIASTHRVYSIAEKSAMADGRYDARRILDAAAALARRRVLDDFSALARAAGGPLNAVLLGLIAGTGQLPLPRESYVAAIRARGIAVEANLAAFAAGRNWHTRRIAPAAATDAAPPPATVAEASLAAATQRFPAAIRDLVQAGAARLRGYQDEQYVEHYLERLASVLELDDPSQGFLLSGEVARYLALWMSYEDIARVADLKTRASRLTRIRGEAGAAADEPVRVREYLKPGAEELAAMLPRPAARLLRWLGGRRGLPLRLGTHTVTGFVLLRALAGLRRWRRRSLRFAEEQALIERWLDALRQAARTDYALALAVTACANLNKGYGETFMRGRENFLVVLGQLIEPLLARATAPPQAAARVRAVYEAALRDPQGAARDAQLGEALAWLAGGNEAPARDRPAYARAAGS